MAGFVFGISGAGNNIIIIPGICKIKKPEPKYEIQNLILQYLGDKSL